MANQLQQAGPHWQSDISELGGIFSTATSDMGGIVSTGISELDSIISTVTSQASIGGIVGTVTSDLGGIISTVTSDLGVIPPLLGPINSVEKADTSGLQHAIGSFTGPTTPSRTSTGDTISETADNTTPNSSTVTVVRAVSLGSSSAFALSPGSTAVATGHTGSTEPGSADNGSSKSPFGQVPSSPPNEYSASQRITSTVIKSMVPILIISVALVFWIKRRKLAEIFCCLSKKQIFGRRDVNADDTESAQVRPSQHASITDITTSHPGCFKPHKDRMRRDSLASDSATVPTRSSILQVPLEHLDEKKDPVNNPFASPEDDEVVPGQCLNSRIGSNPVGINRYSGSLLSAPASDPINEGDDGDKDDDDVSALRNDVVLLRRELFTLRATMAGQPSAAEELPSYNHLFDGNLRSQDSGGR